MSELNELEEEVKELFLKKLRSFCDTWDLNKRRGEIMAVALREVADELEEADNDGE